MALVANVDEAMFDRGIDELVGDDGGVAGEVYEGDIRRGGGHGCSRAGLV